MFFSILHIYDEDRLSGQSLIRRTSMISVRNATLLIELRSGRVGSMTVDSQSDLDKLLERFVLQINKYLWKCDEISKFYFWEISRKFNTI